MKVPNCLYCCTHWDNREYKCCELNSHRFQATKKEVAELQMVLDEYKEGRLHKVQIDYPLRTLVANYAYGVGETEVYEQLTNKK